MPVPTNWWSCDHPSEAVVLLRDQVNDGNFYACNNCGLVEGEHDFTEDLVNSRLKEQME